MRVAKTIELTDDERDRLMRFAHAERSEVRLARRAGIVLLCADGLDNLIVGEMLGIDRILVGRWRNRYATGGFEAIACDRPRGGRKPVVDRAEVVRLTTQSKPAAATQWSTRSLAAVAGCSDSTVQRIWKKHGLKPPRVHQFKVSRDPRFVEKLEDIVGWYNTTRMHSSLGYQSPAQFERDCIPKTTAANDEQIIQNGHAARLNKRAA